MVFFGGTTATTSTTFTTITRQLHMYSATHTYQPTCSEGSESTRMLPKMLHCTRTMSWRADPSVPGHCSAELEPNAADGIMPPILEKKGCAMAPTTIGSLSGRLFARLNASDSIRAARADSTGRKGRLHSSEETALIAANLLGTGRTAGLYAAELAHAWSPLSVGSTGKKGNGHVC